MKMLHETGAVIWQNKQKNNLKSMKNDENERQSEIWIDLNSETMHYDVHKETENVTKEEENERKNFLQHTGIRR